MAADNLVHVFMSAATLDKQIAGNLEPRAAAPRRRIEVMGILKGSGVSVGLLCSPIIPGLTDLIWKGSFKRVRRQGFGGWLLVDTLAPRTEADFLSHGCMNIIPSGRRRF